MIGKGEQSMDPTLENQEAIEKVRELIKGIETAMLTTVSEEGLVSRPMKTQDMDFDGSLWFLTKKDTTKFHELLQNQQVNVAYAGKSYVSIRGEAELVESVDKLKQFWNPVYEEMLETTYDDPNLILIKVNAEAAEYWDSGNNFKMVKFLFRRLMGKNTEGTDMNQTVEWTVH
jgi:general stress protein 26